MLPAAAARRLLDPGPAIRGMKRCLANRHAYTYDLTQQHNILATNKEQSSPYFGEDVLAVYSLHCVLQHKVGYIQ